MNDLRLYCSNILDYFAQNCDNSLAKSVQFTNLFDPNQQCFSDSICSESSQSIHSSHRIRYGQPANSPPEMFQTC